MIVQSDKNNHFAGSKKKKNPLRVSALGMKRSMHHLSLQLCGALQHFAEM